MASQRPLEWMKFNPVRFGLLASSMELAEEGALIRVLRHLWEFGPMTEAAVRRIAKGSTEAVLGVMTQGDAGWTLEMVEDARADGKRAQDQRIEAGKASAAKRNGRSTAVGGSFNGRSTAVLSKSLSDSGKKERAATKEPEVFFDDASITAQDAATANPALKAKNIDWGAYTEAISIYSAVKGIKRTRRGWLATYRQFVATDQEKGLLKVAKPVFVLPEGGVKEPPMFSTAKTSHSAVSGNGEL